jgi:hypothetical protein
LIVVLLRHSRARVVPRDVCLLLLFAVAACLQVRMVPWYAAVLMVVLTPHLADVARRFAASVAADPLRRLCEPLQRRSFRITLATGLAVWVTFCIAPVSRPLLGGKPRPVDKVFDANTPLGVTEYLREHPPQGTVVAPEAWGDWLLANGPENVEVMMTTRAVSVVPSRVWKDYYAIWHAEAGLELRLDRYRISTLVVAKKLQPELVAAVEQLAGVGDWDLVYEDDVGLVAVRTALAPDAAASDPAQVALRQ